MRVLPRASGRMTADPTLEARHELDCVRTCAWASAQTEIGHFDVTLSDLYRLRGQAHLTAEVAPQLEARGHSLQVISRYACTARSASTVMLTSFAILAEIRH